MFDDFSKRSKAVRAALDLAREGLGRHQPRRHRTGGQCQPRRSPPRVHLQERHPPRLPGRGRCRGAGQGPRCWRGAKPARPAVRSDHDAVRGDAALQGSAEAHLRLSLLPPRRGRAAALLLARLAILDAGRRRRQARRPWRRAPRRRAHRDLRQGVPGLARRRYAVARQDHGRARQAARQGRAHAVRHRDGLRRFLPLRSAGSCRAAGSAAGAPRRRPHRQPAARTDQSGRSSSSPGPDRSSGPSPGSALSTGSPASGVSGSSGRSSCVPAPGAISGTSPG